MLSRGLAALLLSLPVLTPAQSLPEHRDPKQRFETIGTATMEPDGTIVLQLRSLEANGMIAEGVLRYSPGDPGYSTVSRHIGKISSGETVFVRPFPDGGRARRSTHE